MKKNSTWAVTIAACVCFAAAAASQLVSILRYGALGSFPALIALLLIVVGLMLRRSLLIAAGGIIQTALSLIAAATANYDYVVRLPNAVRSVRSVLAIAAAALLLALALSKRRSVLLGWLSGGCALLSVLLNWFGWRIPGMGGLPQKLTVSGVALSAAAVLGRILAGYARREMPSLREEWKRHLK